jgi:hypothetical protein
MSAAPRKRYPKLSPKVEVLGISPRTGVKVLRPAVKISKTREKQIRAVVEAAIVASRKD